MPTAAAKTTKKTGVAIDPIVAALADHKRLDKATGDLIRAGAHQYDVDRACDAAERGAWRMARTKPTTTAGAAALLAYIATGPITGLFTLGETGWHETAFKTVAKALAEIARQAA